MPRCAPNTTVRSTQAFGFFRDGSGQISQLARRLLDFGRRAPVL
jgi:hypothetical protein